MRASRQSICQTLLQTLFLLAALATSAVAHFVIQSPPFRGFNEEVMSVAPCGGFPDPSTTRAPLTTNATLSIMVEHPNANMSVNIGFGPNATDFSQTLATVLYPKGGTYNLTVNLYQQMMMNGMMMNHSLETGAVGTLQVVMTMNGTKMYQCVDFVVGDNSSNSSSSSTPDPSHDGTHGSASGRAVVPYLTMFVAAVVGLATCAFAGVAV